MVKKKILYLGNKLSHKGRNSTGVETLGKQLEQVGYQVVSVSAFSNKLVRLIHMLSTVIIKSKKSDVLLLDTYSTANFWYAYLSEVICRIGLKILQRKLKSYFLMPNITWRRRVI